MRAKYFLLTTIMIVSTVPICAQSKTSGSQIDYFIRAVKTRNIESVEIFGVPLDALFRTNVTPERLEKLWNYKVVLRDSNAFLEVDAEELTPILRNVQIQPSATKLDFVDVRVGFVFFAKEPEGKRVASIYFDRSGRLGAFNNMPASFSPDFFLRLKRALRGPLIDSILYSVEPGVSAAQFKPK